MNKKARARIAAIRAQNNLVLSDGHISYNAHTMNFIADLNEREEKAIVNGYKRLRRQAYTGGHVRPTNVLLAEGEPTPRHQKYLQRMSRTAIRQRNPLGYGNSVLSGTPRPRATRSAPQQSNYLLQRQFTSRSNRGKMGSGFSDMSSLPPNLDSYRSIASNASDVSLGDIDALEAQKAALEARLMHLNASLALRATTSPKLQRLGANLSGSSKASSGRSFDANPISGRRGSGTSRSRSHLSTARSQQESCRSQNGDTSRLSARSTSRSASGRRMHFSRPPSSAPRTSRTAKLISRLEEEFASADMESSLREGVAMQVPVAGVKY